MLELKSMLLFCKSNTHPWYTEVHLDRGYLYFTYSILPLSNTTFSASRPGCPTHPRPSRRDPGTYSRELGDIRRKVDGLIVFFSGPLFAILDAYTFVFAASHVLTSRTKGTCGDGSWYARHLLVQADRIARKIHLRLTTRTIQRYEMSDSAPPETSSITCGISEACDGGLRRTPE
jgi:hypothetical protein